MSPKMQRMDIILANALRNIIPNYKQDFFERNRQIDNIIVWLVGLSTGFIVLIISQFNQLKSINTSILKYTVFFSLLTILLGVIHRILYYFCEGTQSQILFHLECTLLGYTEPTTSVPCDFSLEENPKTIAEYLKHELDFNCDKFLQYNMPIEEWRDFYNKHISLWKSGEQDGIKFIESLIADSFDIPGYKIFGNNTNQATKANLAKRIERLCQIIYISTLISFALSVIIIGLYFVFFLNVSTII